MGNHEYTFTTIVYGVLSLLRFVEYFLLVKQFYKFIFDQKDRKVTELFSKQSITKYFFRSSKRLCYFLLLSVFCSLYLLLGLAIPSVGIYLEIEHSKRLCYRHYYEVYMHGVLHCEYFAVSVSMHSSFHDDFYHTAPQ